MRAKNFHVALLSSREYLEYKLTTKHKVLKAPHSKQAPRKLGLKKENNHPPFELHLIKIRPPLLPTDKQILHSQK